MKRVVIFVLFLALAASCFRDEEGQEKSTGDKDSLKTDTALSLEEPVWEYNIDKDIPVKKDSTATEKHSPKELLTIVNHQFKDKVKFDFKDISHDTLFLKIDNADHLTRESGSAGAKAILATAIFTLTESDSIHFVDLHFQEGDHAAPGTYSREDFKSQKINKTK